MKANTKTMAIKSRAYNQIQAYFQDIKKWNKATGKHEQLNPLFDLSDDEKMEAIKKIMSETIPEVRNYKADRKKKNQINKLRQERGYKPKKKTTKAQWEASQKSKLVAA